MRYNESESGTRLLVVADEDGNIQAATLAPSGNPEGDASPQFGFLPGDGQTLHEVELPKELRSAEGLLSLLEFRVATDNGQVQLARKGSES